jgi:hypothetical protein
MKKAGASEAQIESFMGDIVEEDPVLLIENKAVFLWFLDIDDLFIFNGAVAIGLDLNAISIDAQMSGREYTTEDYKKLRHIGRTASNALNEGSKWH